MTFSPQNVVVPVDFSQDSAPAVRTAVELAGDATKVHVIHVLFPLDYVSPGVLLGDVDDARRRQAVHESFQKLLEENNLPAVGLEVVFGDPGTEVCNYAEKVGADLVVIPSHGYHGFKRLLLGSVAERVIRHVHCSVLVLRRADAE